MSDPIDVECRVHITDEGVRAFTEEIKRLKAERDEWKAELKALYWCPACRSYGPENVPCRVCALIQELDEARAELHEWRTKRLHGGCEEERLAEVARRVDAERERDAARAALERTLNSATGLVQEVDAKYRARIAELEAALRPFASRATNIDNIGSVRLNDDAECLVRLGELRAARRALDAAEEKKDPGQ